MMYLGISPSDLTDALIVEAKYPIDNEKREVFFFRYSPATLNSTYVNIPRLTYL